MLQRVVLGQARFNLPGLAMDSRGVACGRQLAVRFGAIDRLVSFLRLLSAEQSLDDLQGGLRMVHVRASEAAIAGTRETIVIVPVMTARIADVVARCARTAGGYCFTGTGKHFVPMRDRQSPLGYDAEAMVQATGDFVLYSAERATSYMVESELPLGRLLERLALQRRHGGPEESRDVVFATARRGLGTILAAYLHRAGVRAAAAICDYPTDNAFRPRGRPESGFWLFRIEKVPARMMGLLAGTPGLELFQPVTANVVVASGFRHPIHLESCRATFPADRFFIFSSASAGAITVDPAPSFVDVENLVRVESPSISLADKAPAASRSTAAVAVPLRLAPATRGRGRALGALVPWRQITWLRRLCYALPPAALRGYRVALLDRGALVIAPAVLEGIPFGALLDAAAPGVYVPAGMQIVPALSPALLAARLGAADGDLVVFPAAGEPPFRVAAARVEPLERRAMADLDIAAAERAAGIRHPGAEGPSAAPQPIEVENLPLGPMPLWRV